MSKELTISKPIAPEDIRPGMYLARLYIVGEHLPAFCADDAAWKPIKTTKILWLPLPWMENHPLKVEDVCLPYVFTKTPEGELSTLDVRRYRFAQLSESYGKKVFKLLKARMSEKKGGGCVTW